MADESVRLVRTPSGYWTIAGYTPAPNSDADVARYIRELLTPARRDAGTTDG